MRYECGICWTVYDPALGDGAAQIPPQTSFEALPAAWHCPTCAAPKERFLVRGENQTHSAKPIRSAEEIAAAVRAAYLSADEKMRGLPVHNPRLGFDTIGFRAFDGAHTGIAITPWSMMLVRIPFERAQNAVPGESVTRRYPSGEYDFTIGELSGLGLVETSSLFSPMQEFTDPAAAREAAEAAIEALFAVPQAPPTKVPSRRSLLFGGQR